jgi:hypothetical protein
MKKLIVIAVVFALVAGVAFAETRVSGTIDTRIKLLDGSNADGDNAKIGGEGVADGYVQLSGQDDDAKIGGLVRVRANEAEGNFHRAFVWWKPVPQLQVFLGHDLDGKFVTDPLTAWGFHQGGESFVERHDWDFWRMVFPGNWDGFGLAFSVYPVSGVDINLVVPTGLPEWYPGGANAGKDLSWEEFLDSLRLQSEIGIPDIGKVFISWIGGRANLIDSDAAEGVLDYGQIGLSFLLTAVDGLQLQAGFSTYLMNADNLGKFPSGDDQAAPLAIGLAAHYASGDFGVKFRSAFVLNAYAATQTTADSWKYRAHNQWYPYEQGTLVTFNVMPWYNLGILTGYLDIGADIAAPEGADDSPVYFWLNPYIRKSIGPGAIRAGIMVGIDAPNPDVDAVITFRVPIQFTFSF